MLGFIFLLALFHNGYFIQRVVFDKRFAALTPISSFLLGSIFGITLIFLCLLIGQNLLYSLFIYFGISLLILAVSFKKKFLTIAGIKLNRNLLLNLILFCITFFAFQKTFSYTPDKSFLIASNLYQDFGAHIPFIRYFSSGHSVMEVPFFAGEGLTYHFMFDFYSGILENLGLRIDIAINLISALSLVFFFNMLFKYSKTLVKSAAAGVLTCVFFILNSDLSFIQIIQKYGVSLVSYYQRNTYIEGNILGFPINGNFLNINAYMNQRHLIFGLLWFLYVVFIFIARGKKELNNKEVILLSVAIGIFPFWHLPILISLYLVLTGIWVFFKDLRRDILRVVLLSLIVVIPQLLVIKQHSVGQILFNPGFMVAADFTLKSFSLFWLWNLGVLIPLAILGFIKSNLLLKKVSLAYLGIFISANLFQFSPNMFDNHKFFNAWVISLNILAALGTVYLFKKNGMPRVVSVLAVLLVTLSGTLNLFVLKNDIKTQIPDYRRSDIIRWINSNTNPNAIFLTNGEIYDPIQINGGRTFLGRVHYIYLYGGDATKRINMRETVFRGNDIKKN